MMEAAESSKTLVNFYQTTRCHNPEDSHLRTNRRENLKSHISYVIEINCFAISYSLLEGQLSRERIWPSVLHLCHDVSQKHIPQSEEFTENTNTVVSRCAPLPAAP
jgi:hypothetical protein